MLLQNVKDKTLSILKKLYPTVWSLGTLSGCHQMKERSFHIRGKQLLVCARCTGAFIGYLIGALTFVFYRIPFWICLLFCAIMFTDWLIQRLNILPSNNTRRLITGILCGAGLSQLYLLLLVTIVKISNRSERSARFLSDLFYFWAFSVIGFIKLNLVIALLILRLAIERLYTVNRASGELH